MTFETEYLLQEFRDIQDQHFDDDGKAFTGTYVSTGIMERMLNLINQLEKELNNHQAIIKMVNDNMEKISGGELDHVSLSHNQCQKIKELLNQIK